MTPDTYAAAVHLGRVAPTIGRIVLRPETVELLTGPNSSEKFEGARLRACGSGGRLEIRGGRRRRKVTVLGSTDPDRYERPGFVALDDFWFPSQVVSLAFVLSLFSASRELSEQHHERALARANLLRAAANYGIETSPV